MPIDDFLLVCRTSRAVRGHILAGMTTPIISEPTLCSFQQQRCINTMFWTPSPSRSHIQSTGFNPTHGHPYAAFAPACGSSSSRCSGSTQNGIVPSPVGGPWHDSSISTSVHMEERCVRPQNCLKESCVLAQNDCCMAISVIIASSVIAVRGFVVA